MFLLCHFLGIAFVIDGYILSALNLLVKKSTLLQKNFKNPMTIGFFHVIIH